MAVEDASVATQGQVVIPINVNNHQRSIDCQISSPRIPWNQQLYIAVNAPGSKSIIVMHNRRSVARLEGEKGKARIDPRVLGVGPIRLQAIGISGKADKSSNVFSDPVDLEVVSPPGLPELPKALASSAVRSAP